MSVQKFSYHTHTDFSDGRNTVEEMLQQAVKIGFAEFGITDHLTFHKNFNIFDDSTLSFKENLLSRKKRLIDRVNYIKEVSKNYPISVKVGAEVDFFSYEGWLESFKELIDGVGFDYLISGTHFTEDNDEMISLFKIKEYESAKQKELISKHFDNIIKAVESKMFTFIAHPDFIRWAGIVDVDDYMEERKAIIEALAKTNTAYEINTKGIDSIGDFYPAKWMIDELNKRNVPVVISDDAHATEQLGRYFTEAEKLLSEIGYKNRWKFYK